MLVECITGTTSRSSFSRVALLHDDASDPLHSFSGSMIALLTSVEGGSSRYSPGLAQTFSSWWIEDLSDGVEKVRNGVSEY